MRYLPAAGVILGVLRYTAVVVTPTAEWTVLETGGGAGEDFARGAACHTDGRCVASGDISNLGSPPGTYPVRFGDQVVPVDFVSALSSYVWRFEPEPQTPQIIPNFGSVDVAIQSDGTVVMAGMRLTATGRDASIIGLDGSGGIEYITTFGTGSTDSVNEVAIGPDDSIAVIGPFGFGETSRDMLWPDGSTSPFFGGDMDVFVAMFNSRGGFRWGVGLAGIGHEEGRGVVVTPAGDVAVCGEFDRAVKLGAWGVSRGGADTFVALLDGLTGRPKWAKQFGGPGDEICRGIAIGKYNEIIIAGEYSDAFKLGDYEMPASDGDLWIARLDATTGRVTAALAFGSEGKDYGCEIEGTTSGVWCSGSATGELSYPGGTLPTSGDQFVLRFDLGLNSVSQALSLGGEGTSLNMAVGAHPGGGIVVGTVRGTITAGELQATAKPGKRGFYAATWQL
jgi:hypothetical protein